MSDVLHRTTLEYKKSVNTPDYPEVDWVLDPDLSNVAGVPTKFWKLSGNVVTEMSLDEKDVVYLASNKAARYNAVDFRTTQLIEAGFTYASKSFSLSGPAQLNWLTLQAIANKFTWPVKISTLDNGEYSLEQVNLDAFAQIAKDKTQGHLDSGRALKLQINAATTQAALDAVVDTRS